MYFGVQPRFKTPNSGVAHCKLSTSQESENEQIQNQIDAHLFFDRGLSTWNFALGQTINQPFYVVVIERLVKMLARTRPGIAHTWMLHHYNAPCHTAVSINQFLAEKTCDSSAPYSPYLCSRDLFLFPRLKNHLK